MVAPAFRLLAPLLLALGLLLGPSAAAAPRAQGAPLAFPEGFMRSVKAYGATGDGVTDDTAAINAALADGRVDAEGRPLYPSPDDYNGRPKALFFPAGTYRVSGTLSWVGCCLTIQGQGRDHTVIKLVDGAAGFGDPAAPRAVIRTEQGNESFRQNISDLTVDTGRNNPGAIGIDYITNNSGSLRRVTIRSGDGAGFAGLAMDRQWPGPCLIADVSVEGFDYGVRVTPGEYGPTFERLTLRNQRVAGIRNVFGSLAIRQLTSVNRVPAIKGEHQASLVALLDSSLTGGTSATSAIDTPGQLYVRNLRTTGYASAIRRGGTVVPGSDVGEYFSNQFQLFDSPRRSLGLPIAETPLPPAEPLASWGSFAPRWYGDTGPLQALFNSGKSTIAFPFSYAHGEGAYLAYNEAVVVVPPTVRRIVGFHAGINSDRRGTNGGGIKFVIAEGSAEPLVIEQFGYGIKVEHRAARTLVLRDGAYSYTDGPGAGDLFLENVIIGPLRLNHTRNVWARQLNTESQPVKVDNRSARLWVLGFKTEGSWTTIRTSNGASTELLGAFLMGIHVDTPEEREAPVFVVEDARASLVYRQIGYQEDRNYPVLLSERRNGETRTQLRGTWPNEVALLSAYAEGAPVTPDPRQSERLYLPLIRR
jgi:hypothetical protein